MIITTTELKILKNAYRNDGQVENISFGERRYVRDLVEKGLLYKEFGSFILTKRGRRND